MQDYLDVCFSNDYTEPRSFSEFQVKYSFNEQNEFIRRKLFRTDLNCLMSWDVFLMLVGRWWCVQMPYRMYFSHVWNRNTYVNGFLYSGKISVSSFKLVIYINLYLSDLNLLFSSVPATDAWMQCGRIFKL